MTYDKKLPKIALGAWAWGNDNTFGGELSIDELRPIYDEAMDLGLNLWDTAFAYGMGTSEKVLGRYFLYKAICAIIKTSEITFKKGQAIRPYCFICKENCRYRIAVPLNAAWFPT